MNFKPQTLISPPSGELEGAFAFGMPMSGRSYTSENYRFGFNGQEKENDISYTEGGHLVFTYRIHDARLGRFLSVDPLASSYPFYSSYQFAGNKSINSIDIEGLEEFEKIHWYNVCGELYKTELNYNRNAERLNGSSKWSIHNHVDESGNLVSVSRMVENFDKRNIKLNAFTVKNFALNDVSLNIVGIDIDFHNEYTITLDINDKTNTWSNKFSMNLKEEKNSFSNFQSNNLTFGGMKNTEKVNYNYFGKQNFTENLEGSTLSITKGGNLFYIGNATIEKNGNVAASIPLNGAYVNMGFETNKVFIISDVQERPMPPNDSIIRAIDNPDLSGAKELLDSKNIKY